MITENYVSFETAKLLKEKGFDETCYACYEYFSSSITMYSGWPFEYKGEPVHNSKDIIICPTLQMAMKWLREVYNMYYEIQLLLGEKAEKYGGLQLGIYQLNSSGAYVWKDWIYADTYVELYENYIKYCLENLI